MPKWPTGRLYRLMMKLQDLDYEIIYYPGVLNRTADVKTNWDKNEYKYYSRMQRKQFGRTIIG